MTEDERKAWEVECALVPMVHYAQRIFTWASPALRGYSLCGLHARGGLWGVAGVEPHIDGPECPRCRSIMDFMDLLICTGVFW